MVGMERKDLIIGAVGAVAAIPVTAKEISFVEGQTGIDFEEARPGAGAPFTSFMKWFAAVEGGKVTANYVVQDRIGGSIATFLYGLLLGNVGMDILFYANPDWYRKFIELSPV